MDEGNVFFDVRVIGEDGEGESIGTFIGPGVPRAGDDFNLKHPALCRDKDEYFIGVVESVSWNTCRQARGVWVANAVVWLGQKGTAVTLYCECTKEELTSVSDGGPVDAEGNCASCGRRPR